MSGTSIDYDADDPRIPHLVIRPGPTSLRRYIADLAHHRYLIQILGRREIKLRYRQTLLGPIWIVLQPILSAGILSFIFGRVADLPTQGVPAFLFTYVSMLLWSAFSSNLGRSGSVVLNNSGLVAKVFFPRLALPLSTVYGTVVDFTVTGVLVLVLAWANGFPPGLPLLLLPLWVGFTLMIALGFGTIVGSVAVRYRDALQISGVASSLLLYVTPVAYSATAVPERYETLYYLNPLAALFEAFRWSVLGTPFPTATHLAYAVALSVALFVLGFVFMERMEPRFADVI